MLTVILIIISISFIFFLSLLQDWLIYKCRGTAQSDSKDESGIVIANPEDAISHRVVELGNLSSSDQSKNKSDH